MFTKREASDRVKKGHYLLIIAWIVEIIAVIIGFIIAYMNGQAVKEQLANPTDIQIWMAMLPFIMIAVVEITKIPFAYAFYTAHNIFWKAIFLISLVFLMFITFETAINGFERNFANMKQVVEEKRHAINKYKGEIINKRNEINLLEKTSIETLTQEYRESISLLDNEINDIRANVSSHKSKIIRDNILKYEKDIETIKKDSSKKIQKILDKHDKSFSRKNKNFDNQIKEYNKELQRLLKLREEELKRDSIDSQGLFSTSAKEKITKKYDLKIDELNMKKENIQSMQNELSSNGTNPQVKRIEEKNDKKIKQLSKNINSLQSKLTKIENKLAGDSEKKISVLENEKKKTKEEFIHNKSIIENKNKRSTKLKEEIFVKQEKIDDIALNMDKASAQNQVYRFALGWYGGECIDGSNTSNCEKIERVSDLSSAHVNTVASIWFGSLAAIVAWTGVLLALAGIVLKDETQHPSQHVFKKITRSIRRALAIFYTRHKRERIIEVEVEKEVIVEREKIVYEDVEFVREVPVDKVVFKEIPVEVVKNEYVYIPLYTNDIKLLNTTGHPTTKKDEIEHEE